MLFIGFGTIRFGTGLKLLHVQQRHKFRFGTIRFGTGLKLNLSVFVFISSFGTIRFGTGLKPTSASNQSLSGFGTIRFGTGLKQIWLEFARLVPNLFYHFMSVCVNYNFPFVPVPFIGSPIFQKYHRCSRCRYALQKLLHFSNGQIISCIDKYY